jgi:hypothetical protein
VIRLALTLLLISASTVSAQDPRTPPYVADHKDTGEPGVWIPNWLQQEHLQDAAALEACADEKAAAVAEAAERGLEANAARKANTELQTSVTGLQKTLSVTSLDLKDEKAASENRLIWAWTSTGIAAVALSALVVALAN